MKLLHGLLLVLLLFCVTICMFDCSANKQLIREKQTVNPLQFGLNNAKTGDDRYYVLKRTHEEAKRLGVGVSYSGINKIDITIPPKAKSIPLTHFTDFAGVTIQVENNQRDFYLFSLTTDMIPVQVKGKEIDDRDFSKNEVLRSVNKMLVVADLTPWVDNRIGYDYGAMRKDIVMVRNGEGENGPIQSYSTPASKPNCYYCDVDEAQKIVIKNIEFNRKGSSTRITNLFKIENQYNVFVSDVTINTPEGSGLHGDHAIHLENSMRVSLSDITINGTYSANDEYGYGIYMNNIYDFQVENMYARANWGVFGSNNVQKALLKKCDIDRFDIHCYGKDISFKDCLFSHRSNQFSSVYGLISFENCTFTDYMPIKMGYTYNAYVAHNVRFVNCTFNIDKSHNCIIGLNGFCQDESSRPELKEKCLPNVSIIDCQINSVDGVKKWYVYKTKSAKDYNGKFSYISEVRVEGLSTDEKELKMDLFSNEVQTMNKVKIINELK